MLLAAPVTFRTMCYRDAATSLVVCCRCSLKSAVTGAWLQGAGVSLRG